MKKPDLGRWRSWAVITLQQSPQTFYRRIRELRVVPIGTMGQGLYISVSVIVYGQPQGRKP